MSQVYAQDTNVDIDLGQIFLAIKKNIANIIIAVIATSILAFFVVNNLDEKYRAQARILIDNREPDYTAQQQIINNQSVNVFDERGITSQVEILKSNDLVKQVASDLDLASYEEFKAAEKPSFFKKTLIKLKLIPNSSDTLDEERILREFYERLDVYQIAQSRVIVIEFSSRNPNLAAKIPNMMADAFLRAQSDEKLEDNSVANAWLKPEIERLRKKVNDAEAQVAQYRSEKDLLLVGETNTLNVQQLLDISSQLTRVRSERVDADARVKTIRSILETKQSLQSVTDVLNSITIQRLHEGEADIRGKIADLSTTLLEAHPRMQALRAQLVDIQRQLRIEARKVLTSLENEASVAQLREYELQTRLNAIKASSARAGEEKVQLRALERDATSLRQLLETYLSRFGESASRTQANATLPDARIISRAIKPTQSYFPKKIPIILASMFSIAVIGMISIMLAELFSGRALRPVINQQLEVSEPLTPALNQVEQNGHPTHHQNDQSITIAPSSSEYQKRIEKYVNKKVNSAPKAPLETSLVNHDISDGKTSQEPVIHAIDDLVSRFKTSRTRLVVCLSPEGDEASMGSLMLARKLSEHDQLDVVFVDLTHNGRPSDKAIGKIQPSGITNLLCGEASIAEAIYLDQASRVHVMASGHANIQHAHNLLNQLPLIIRALCDSYDIVIIECGSSPIAHAIPLIGDETTEFVISVQYFKGQDLAETYQEFTALGFHNPVTLDLGNYSYH